MNKLFRLPLALVVAGAACMSPAVGAQDAYPSKPIRMVVPFPPGGSIDMTARLIGQKLSTSLGQPVLVDNRPGASGNIGMDFVAKAPKDGYTLLMVHAGLASNAHMFAKLPYDPIKDLAPVIRVADQPNVLLMNPKWPFKNVAELVAYAKANPGKLSVGTSGVGGPQDVAARRFMRMTGTDLLNVAYKGGAPALSDLVGGQIDLMFETSPTAVPYAKSGKLKALGVTGDKRIPILPEVPTVAESGVPGYRSMGWIGLVAPAGTPSPVIAKLNEQVQALLKNADTQKQITELSLEVVGGSTADFTSFVGRESDDYARFVKDFDITPQ
ncbi:Bug family tripartite tricarboxylate transporter substrate binding protein [Variovorax saccharolyticus]|uniref:Bug family tripartite tricarboxylate transporter substrate binding protein n=1 Tax=Variovorax saccharolyticus TaxID=3053516 RepID=UPI002575CF74|nr:tripartite tricarboxylate transporter substrate binding protein [Variovorax sp. J31P216]MDM0024344.1 tripartite tricarboxylate transporter substrate binding protein [Variovorax sp. J31P216]